MKKAGIDRKSWESRGFHEIVAFAEVEKFIDTPVKRYSSGRYLRLEFAVAGSAARGGGEPLPNARFRAGCVLC